MENLFNPAIIAAVSVLIGSGWYLRGLFADVNKQLDEQGRRLDSLESRMENLEVMLATLLQLARRNAEGDEDEGLKS